MAKTLVVEESFMVTRWWVQLIRGILAILFGIILVVWPLLSIATLVLIFGIWAVVFGVVAIVASILSHEESWWALLIEGLVSAAIGVLVLLWPGVTIFILLVFLAVWALITGVAELAMAIKMRGIIPNDWTLVLAGLFSILFGVLILFWTEETLRVLAWFVGFYAMFFGIIMIVLSMKLRGLQKKA